MLAVSHPSAIFRASWLFLLLVFPLGRLQAQSADQLPTLQFSSTDRILVLAPHPDDESLGCGGVLARASSLNLPTTVVFFTAGDKPTRIHGDFFDWWWQTHLPWQNGRTKATIRHSEALQAARELGLKPSHLIFLGYPDGETNSLLEEHWNGEPPLIHPRLDDTLVGYRWAAHPQWPLKAESAELDLARIIRQFKPTKIFVSHPADYHPDHNVLYVFTRIALMGVPDQQPELYAYLTHYPRWPQRKRALEGQSMWIPDRLAADGAWVSFWLTPEEQKQKLCAIGRHQSQHGARSRFLTSFARRNEMFEKISPTDKRFRSLEGDESTREGERNGEKPDPLTREERSAFVALGWESVKIESGTLHVGVRLSHPLELRSELTVDVFGVRRHRNFSRMPKIRILLTGDRYTVFDQSRALFSRRYSLPPQQKIIWLDLPLRLLAYPDRIFLHARVGLKEAIVSVAPWRLVKIKLRFAPPSSPATNRQGLWKHFVRWSWLLGPFRQATGSALTI